MSLLRANRSRQAFKSAPAPDVVAPAPVVTSPVLTAPAQAPRAQVLRVARRADQAPIPVFPVQTVSSKSTLITTAGATLYHVIVQANVEITGTGNAEIEVEPPGDSGVTNATFTNLSSDAVILNFIDTFYAFLPVGLALTVVKSDTAWLPDETTPSTIIIT